MGLRNIPAGIERLTELLARIAGLALIGMMLVVCYGVVMRYVLRSPVAWANEFARFSFLPVVAFGLAYALQQGAHVATDFFIRAFSGGTRKGLYLFSAALFFSYSVISCWAGWRLASIAFAKGLYSDEAEIPLVLILAVIPIGFLALSLQVIVQMWKAVSGDSSQRRPSKTPHSK